MRGLEYLHPRVRAKAEKLLGLAEQAGLALKITDTWRTADEQADCVRRGTSRASWPNSAHNWGVAFDICKNVKGHEYDDATFFAVAGNLGKSAGLYWGGDFSNPDKPHFEDREFVPNGSCAALIRQYGSPERFASAWDAPASDWPTLSKGTSGPDVRALQWALCYKGKFVGADGVFGPKTEAAVRDFQSKRGLVADGVCGPKTWAALEGE